MDYFKFEVVNINNKNNFIIDSSNISSNDELDLLSKLSDKNYNFCKDKKCCSLPFAEQIKYLRNVPSQVYGCHLQNEMMNLFELKKIKNEDDKGDAQDKNGKIVELKVSMKVRKDKYCCVQIRGWQEIDYYLILFINAKNINNISYEFFKITKEQMKDELIEFKAEAAHLTKKARENNKNIEMRFDLNDDRYNRWKALYQIDEPNDNRWSNYCKNG
jgi:hypothetical protein